MSTGLQVGLVLVAVAIGFAAGWWLGQPGGPEVTVIKNQKGCWEITQNRDSTKSYIAITKTTGQTIPLKPGETVEVCEEFNLFEAVPYQHVPLDPDPDDE